VAPARQPGNLPGAGRRPARAASRRSGAAPAALDRISPFARADRILDRPRPPPARAAPFRARRGRRLDQHAALPVTETLATRSRLTRSAAVASIATALFLAGLKLWAVWRT